jgi:hypothetical protein
MQSNPKSAAAPETASSGPYNFTKNDPYDHTAAIAFALPTDATDPNHTGMLCTFANGIRFYNTGDTAYAERLADLQPETSISVGSASMAASTISSPCRPRRS